MSDELVERVARAIHTTTWDGDPSDTFDETYESNQKRAREQARAAIAAVHEFRNIYGIAALEAAVERARGEVG